MMSTSTQMTRHISAADTAKILRKRLKAEFPNAKFSIRSKTHAGGASITVKWTDGPLTTDVAAVTSQYKGAGFDGMNNMKHQREHWLKPDGTVMVRHDPGTSDNMGIVSPTDNRDLDDVMSEDAERVRFGADYIHPYRSITNRRQREIEAEEWVYLHCQINVAGQEHNPIRDKMGDLRVTDVAYKMIENQQPDEDLRTTFRRAMGLNTTDETTNAIQPT